MPEREFIPAGRVNGSPEQKSFAFRGMQYQ
jgi:hypothetical protein